MTDDQRRERLERALSVGGMKTHSLGDVVAQLQRGEAQWWANGDDGMIVTEILKYPQAKLLQYWLVFGDLQSCLNMQEQIDEFGLANGCTHAVATGRRGWARAAAAYGWQLKSFRYSKPLGH